MSDKDLLDRAGSAFPTFDRDSTFRRVFDALQSELDTFSGETRQVEQSLRVREATGQSLDLIGAEFGQLGRRRGRDDNTYRQLLLSLVSAFNGRGTVEGVKTGVGAGLAVETSDIRLDEDFANNQYIVELFDWTPHRVSTVDELADLTDPVSVPRVAPIRYFGDRASAGVGTATVGAGLDESVSETIGVGASPGQVSQPADNVLETGQYGTATETTLKTTVAIGFGADELEPFGSGDAAGFGTPP